MTNLRALTLGLLAGTALATPALAQNQQDSDDDDPGDPGPDDLEVLPI